MPERQRGRDPNRYRPKEHLLLPEYHQAARYPDEHTSEQPYDQAKEAIREIPASLSAFRMIAPDTMWYVAVIGDTPQEETRRRITEVLSTGEQVTLSEEMLTLLNVRRLEQNLTPEARETGWVERSIRPRRRTRE